jgi:prepilin-type N-terminal cleavage/methylation domain-containing protein/prepilin-type processing-associated H-X9-DG protein
MNRRRRAFTLIELLVVIAIIAILIGLLVPAVQKVRDAAARMQCANNLHNIALAAHNYQSSVQRFPSGCNVPAGVSGGLSASQAAHFGLAPNQNEFSSWVEGLMPYIEQDNLQKTLNLSKNQYTNLVDSSGNKTPAAPGAQPIKTLVCPSDALPLVPVVQGFSGYYFGIISYGGIAGTTSTFWSSTTLDGIFYVNSSTRISDIRDGTSNTLFFGERFHFDPNWKAAAGGGLDITTYGGWVWTNGFAGEDLTLGTEVPINWMIPPGGTGFAVTDPRLNAIGSGHTGGANVALADGSVRFLTNGIDPTLLVALGTRAGLEPVSPP